MFFVYIVECEDGSLYTGIAKDVAARFRQHLKGLGAKYTRQHKPVRIVYTESAGSRGDALKREISIKSLSRAQKLELIH